MKNLVLFRQGVLKDKLQTSKHPYPIGILSVFCTYLQPQRKISVTSAQKWLKFAAVFLLIFTLGVGNLWGLEYESLYTCDFTTVSTHSYTQNKTFTLNNKSWTASVSQVNTSVFYLGCNSNNASKGVLNNNSTFSDVVTALKSNDASYNSLYSTTHAYALLFENAYDNVTKVNFSWAGGNNVFQVFLFGYTGSAWVKLDSTQYNTSGTAVAGNVEWTGDATNFTKFAIAARPGAVTINAAVTNKTLRATTFTIYKTKVSTYTVLSMSAQYSATNLLIINHLHLPKI